MIRFIVAALAVGFGGVATADDAADVEALAKTYARGFYMNDPETILGTVHLELSKKGAGPRFWGTPHEYLEWLQGDRLRLAGVYHDAPEDQFDETTPSRVVVYEVADGVAALELVAANWYDIFTAVQVNGEWKLLDCTWGQIPEYQDPDVDSGEAAELEDLVRAYAAAAASGDLEGVDAVLHPNVSIRTIVADRGVDLVEPTTRERFRHDLASNDGGPEDVEVNVYNVTQRTGFAKARIGERTEWLQFLKLNGDWKLVNIHWR